MDFPYDLSKKIGLPVDPSLEPKAFSPLLPEELAMASTPVEVPTSSTPLMLDAPEEGPVEELTAAEAYEPYVQAPSKMYPPKVQVPVIDEGAKVARDTRFSDQLTTLRNDYNAAKEDARSRQMKVEMMAAVGNNIGNIVAGAQAMNTKASVTAPQMHKIEVKDMVGRADKNFKENYSNLLKQYKDLQEGTVSAKDLYYGAQKDADRQARYDGYNANAENNYNNRGMRKGSGELKDQADNEVSDKQLASITGFKKTSKLLDDIEAKVSTGKYDKFLGPYASKYENSKEYNPLSDGMDPEFASFQSDTTDSLSQYIKGLSGLTVSDKERTALETSMPKVGDKPSAFMSKLKATRARLLEMQKIEEDEIDRLQGKNVAGYKGKGSPKAAAPAATVERKAPDGRIAIFDAETKQFIKYK